MFKCYNAAVVVSNDGIAECGWDCACTGGVVGCNSDGRVSNCYNTGNVSSGGTEKHESTLSIHTGGVVGDNIYGAVRNCYNAGEVSNSGTGTYVSTGGVVGESKGGVHNCYNTGAVSSSATGKYVSTGGIVGESDSGVRNCYNTGDYLEGTARWGIGYGVGIADSKTEEEMKAPGFVKLLNEGSGGKNPFVAGSYYCNDGYPIFKKMATHC